MEYKCVSFERCWRHRAESVPHCPSCSNAHSLLRIEMCEVNWPAAMLTVTVGIDCANARSHSEANISLRRKREPLHTVNNLNLAHAGFWMLRACFYLLCGCNCGKGVVDLVGSFNGRSRWEAHWLEGAGIGGRKGGSTDCTVAGSVPVTAAVTG